MKKLYKELKKKGVVNDKVKVSELESMFKQVGGTHYMYMKIQPAEFINCLLYTSPSPRDS